MAITSCGRSQRDRKDLSWKAIDEDSGRVDELELGCQGSGTRWNRDRYAGKKIPAVLFDSGDAYADWLYAILIDGDKNRRWLCTGPETDWSTGRKLVVRCLITWRHRQDQAGRSPYLIGRSMVDQDLKSAEVFCFNLRDPAAGWTRLQVTGEFEARMGHAAVVTGERQAWILGGLGKFGPLNDTVVSTFRHRVPKPDRSPQK